MHDLPLPSESIAPSDGVSAAGNTLGIAGIWGIVGISLLLTSSVGRVAQVVVEGLSYPLTWVHLPAAVLWMGFMGYTEGYRGFQLGYSRRVVLRALSLDRETRLMPRILAPLTCMGLIFAPWSRLRVSWFVVLAVVGVVSVVRAIPHPWRAIVDAGVVLGLGWGLVAVWVYSARALAGHPVPEPIRKRTGAGRA